MEVQAGYLYHIKNEFFDVIKDKGLMTNHERGKKRPTYFTIKDEDVLWFIPLSSKVEKYKPIVERKLKKYGGCSTILIREINGKEHAILLQNTFPILEKYIDHVHTVNGKAIKVGDDLKDEILKNFNYLVFLKNKGNDLFFTDIDKIKEQMIEESETNC